MLGKVIGLRVRGAKSVPMRSSCPREQGRIHSVVSLCKTGHLARHLHYRNAFHDSKEV
jgi:hypothetical protein